MSASGAFSAFASAGLAFASQRLSSIFRELDNAHQVDAFWCVRGIMALSTKMMKFTIALDEANDAALRERGECQKPSFNAQSMVRLAAPDHLDRHADAQLPLRLAR